MKGVLILFFKCRTVRWSSFEFPHYKKMFVKSAQKWIIFIVLCLESHCQEQEELEPYKLKSQYSKTVKENKFVLVMFYSKACAKCLPLIPLFQKKFQEYATIEREFKYSAVDVKDGQPKGCELPCMKFFADGNEKIFSGDVNVKNVFRWATNSIKVYEMPRKNNVLLLNAIRFTQLIEGYDYFAVNFYEPKCERCDKLKPVFFTLAKKLASNKSPVLLARLTSPKIAKKYNITDQPAILFFRKGIPTMYEGKFHIDEMEKWLRTLFMASQIKRQQNVMLLNLKNFYKAVRGYKFLAVVFYVPNCGPCKKFLPHFTTAATKMAKEHSPIQLGVVNLQTSPALARNFQIGTLPAIVLVKNGTILLYEGPLRIDAVMKWIKEEASAGPRLPITESKVDRPLKEDESHSPEHLVGSSDKDEESQIISSDPDFAESLNLTHFEPIELFRNLTDIVKDKDINNLKSIVNNINFPDNVDVPTLVETVRPAKFENVLVTQNLKTPTNGTPKVAEAEIGFTTEIVSLENNLTFPGPGKSKHKLKNNLKNANEPMQKPEEFRLNTGTQIAQIEVPINQAAFTSDQKNIADSTAENQSATNQYEEPIIQPLITGELEESVPIPIQPDNPAEKNATTTAVHQSESQHIDDFIPYQENNSHTEIESFKTAQVETMPVSEHQHTAPIPIQPDDTVQNNVTTIVHQSKNIPTTENNLHTQVETINTS